jgi:hypothetical protein
MRRPAHKRSWTASQAAAALECTSLPSLWCVTWCRCSRNRNCNRCWYCKVEAQAAATCLSMFSSLDFGGWAPCCQVLFLLLSLFTKRQQGQVALAPFALLSRLLSTPAGTRMQPIGWQPPRLVASLSCYHNCFLTSTAGARALHLPSTFTHAGMTDIYIPFHPGRTLPICEFYAVHSHNVTSRLLCC